MKKKVIKTLKNIMVATALLAIILVITTLLFVRQDKFGKAPGGARLERIRQSPNFKNGKFQNLSHTPTLAEGHNYFEVIYENYFKNKPRHYPEDLIPSVKTDLLHLPIDRDVLVWFGHSSILHTLIIFININENLC